ncbi:hypothetical protein HYW87_04360 [Candidatus Roizmanbacteria bacterium]|nr:hypothetical protein [Candidatus Roizmanbacteria bacterium]
MNFIIQKRVKQYLNKTFSFLVTIGRSVKPFSLEEYFFLAVEQGLISLKEGNYGVGALYIFRKNGKEIIFTGRSRIISEQNTGLHAEEDVIDVVESIARGEKKYRGRIVKIRKAPAVESKRILISTLEPCIGCVRRILTHKVDEIIIGLKELLSGAMLDGREKMLPPLWQDMRNKQKLIVKLVQHDNPNEKNYLNPLFKKLLLQTFQINRKSLDREMEKGKFINLDSLYKYAYFLKKNSRSLSYNRSL